MAAYYGVAGDKHGLGGRISRNLPRDIPPHFRVHYSRCQRVGRIVIMSSGTLTCSGRERDGLG